MMKYCSNCCGFRDMTTTPTTTTTKIHILHVYSTADLILDKFSGNEREAHGALCGEMSVYGRMIESGFLSKTQTEPVLASGSLF